MDTIPQRAIYLYLLILLCLIIAFTYHPRPTFFSQDDFWFLERVMRAGNMHDLWKLVGAPDHFYRPVPRILILKFEQVLFGLQPFAYHTFSWLIHIANCGMLLGLWRVLWKSSRLSFIAVLYYGLHYAHFVPVTWVSGMQELSVIFWSLICILAYLYRHSSPIGYAFSFVAFSLALFSKETGLSVLVIMVFLDIIQGKPLKSCFLNQVGYWGIVIAFLWLWSEKTGGLPSRGPYTLNLAPALILKNLRWYTLEGLYLRVWNEHLLLSNISLISFSAIVLGTLFSRRHRKPILVGSVWFLAALAPVLLLDRTISYYLCMSLAGLGLILAAIIDMGWSLMWPRIRVSRPMRCMFSTVINLILILGWVSLNIGLLQTVRVLDPLGLQSKAQISHRVIQEVLALYPTLPDSSVLYIRGASERDFWAMGKGSLFRLYYYPTEITVLFDRDTSLRGESLSNVYIYDYKP